MPSLRIRRSVSALVLFTLLPLSGLHAAPSQGRAVRKPPSALERLERQVSSVWSGIVNVWEKMGPRIDDNGFQWKIESELSRPGNGDSTQPKPLS
ncbi:MAG TPA: hypothetical protein VMW27_25580 [Thermoanaerobaculia bacterium]|nr:hypothetical protein [Thermoanaerobaculia bacterium]